MLLLMDTRRRANKKQRKLLIERLYANKDAARGNPEEQQNAKFWLQLSEELNTLGCIRTVQEWQHIWSVWIAKVKTKSRKVRNYITATGQVPAEAGLNDSDNKVLEILGEDPIYNGFTAFGKQEYTQDSFSEGVSSPTEEEQPHELFYIQPQVVTMQPSEEEKDEQTEEKPLRGSTPPLRHRRRVFRTKPFRPSSHHLVQGLRESNKCLQETLDKCTSDIASAIRSNGAAMIRAAEILAAAITSSQNTK